MATIDAPTDILARLFSDGPPRPEWFAPDFLAQVPAEAVAALIAGLLHDHGKLRGVAVAGDAFVIHLARADVPARIALDAVGHIAGLFLQPAIPTQGSVADHVAAIAALPGRTAALVISEGVVRAAHNATLPLAVASAFKLAVLHAVDEQCRAGQLAWNQVVPLDPAWRSRPSGILHDWPAGTPITVATLANLMISISDNTATEALIALAGRPAVEALSPRNTPFLTTREAFDRHDRGAAAEWFFTAHELADLLGHVHHLSPFSIEPGPVDRAAWASVAFKGGSEPGVLNLSARVVAASGAWHALIVTWNDHAPLAHERLLSPFRGVLRALST